MNYVCLIGRLVRDPEICQVKNEKKTLIASFTLAVERRYKHEGQPEADFIDCRAYAKLAELVQKYLMKGSKILINGTLLTGSYENKKGDKVKTVTVNVSNMEFLDRRGDTPVTRAAQAASEPRDIPQDGFMSLPEGLEDFMPFA